jgi:uncharacterized membrane protein YjjP (DUF1212 family)
MSQEAQCNLIVACARLLFVNGQGTEQVVGSAQRLAAALGVDASLSLRWGELVLQSEVGQGPIFRVAANPAGVDMNRVTATMQVIADVEDGRATPGAAMKALDAIARSPAVPAWLFALASGAGAVAMAVLFGLQHLPDAAMIFASAFAGAVLRRGLLRLSTNALVQPFCTSLFAGLFAGIAFKFELIASLRFVALCPCVILIPGAHVLNGLADLINGRLPLGAARLIHASLITAAITTGLLFGLVLCGVALPLTEATRAVPLWQHFAAAAVAVAAFGVLFSMPPRQLLLPVLVGALAQALRWAMLATGFGVGAAALAASLAVGLILIPVTRQRDIPFAAIGFVSIVSMIPGSYLFTMASGLMQIAKGGTATLELISVTVASGTNALLIILAISLGLVIPKLAFDHLDQRRKVRTPRAAP